MILGISFFHNASICLIDRAGNTIFCCSEERFSRNKNDWGFPNLTLEYLWKNIADPSKIESVEVGESCRGIFGSEEFASLLYLKNYDEKDKYIRHKSKMLSLVLKEFYLRVFNKKKSYQELIKKELHKFGLRCPVYFHDHHLSHASSAFYCSPFNEALVVTLDGEGDGLAGSCWIGQGSILKQLCRLPEVSSVGKFYRAITAVLGFKINRHEGKVTGLSAFGDPLRFYESFKDLLYTKDEDGYKTIKSLIAEEHFKQFNLRRLKLNKLVSNIYEYWQANSWEELVNRMIYKKYFDFLSSKLSLDLSKLSFKDKADLAAAAQQILEETVIDFIDYYQNKLNLFKLALAGGIFANVKLNQRILENIDIRDIYIQPGMGDEGLALGAALLGLYRNRGKRLPNRIFENVFCGPEYSDEAIEAELRISGLQWYVMGRGPLSKHIAESLSAGKIVGLFQGKMEFGPRALGNRSILVDPRNPSINQIVNQRLRRTEFMPLAPVVLRDCYKEMFDGDKIDGGMKAAEFMTITVNVKPEWKEKIGGIVHVDGTARPQIIDEKTGIYYDILKEFHKKTGIGCMVNTSFNLHEEPIVNNPAEAIMSFQQGAVDILVMNNYVISNEDRK